MLGATLGLLTGALTVLAATVPFTRGDSASIRDRFSVVRAGLSKRTAAYLVVVASVVAPVAYAAVRVTAYIPMLEWGLLGENVFTAPLNTLVETAAADGSQPDTAGTAADNTAMMLGDVLSAPAELVLLAAATVAFAAALQYAFAVLVVDEEELWRGSYAKVAVWAVLHMFAGIPLYAVIPLFSAGVVYEQIHRRDGFEAAVAAHYAMNSVVIWFLLATAGLLFML